MQDSQPENKATEQLSGSDAMLCQQASAGVILSCLCRCNHTHLRKQQLVGWSHYLWHFSYWLQFSEIQAAVNSQAGIGIWAEPWALLAAKALQTLSSLLFSSPSMCDTYIAATQWRMKGYLLSQFFLSFLWLNIFMHTPLHLHKAISSSALYFTIQLSEIPNLWTKAGWQVV